MVTWVLSWTLEVGSERLKSGFLEDQDWGREVGKGEGRGGRGEKR
jgi:hypothetical protein